MELKNLVAGKNKPLEVAVLCIVITIVWGLLLIPIIFYYSPLPQDQKKDNGTGSELINATSIFTCREDFFRETTYNICVPHCPNWRQDAKAVSMTIDIVVSVAYFTGFVASIGILIISMIRHKAMFVFPNSLVVHMTIVNLFHNSLYIVTFFDRAKLYCSSENLFAAFSNVTPFCAISGIIQVYSTVSVSLWWFMLTAAAFWKIWFPFHARSFQGTRKIKYLHVGCCLVGILLPVIPVIVLLTNFGVQVQLSGGSLSFFSGGLGFVLVRFPPFPCSGGNTAIVFYSIILPTNLLLAIGISLTILLFWIVHKKYGLFKEMKSKNPFKISKSERKLLVILCYYILSTVINLTAFADFSRKHYIFNERLNSYFSCEQFGHDPNNPCTFDTPVSFALVVLSYGFHGTLSLINLIFVVDIEDLKTIYKRRFKKKITTSGSKRVKCIGKVPQKM